MKECKALYNLPTGAHELSISFINNGSLLYQQITDDKFISYHDNDRTYMLSITKLSEDEFGKSFNCSSLSLEMINEVLPAYKATQAMTITEYMDIFGLFKFAKIEIGINELAGKKLTLEWEGESDTNLARLISLVNKFGGEHEFIDRINRDGTLKPTLINLYQANNGITQGVGTRRNDKTFYYKRNIDTITRTVDKTNLFTAIHPIGKDDLNISSLEIKEYDDDGNLLYVSLKGEPYILCPPMRDRYPSQIVDNTERNYTLLEWSYETDNVNTLAGQGLAKLKTISQPAVSYEVTGYFDLQIGDTVKAHDSGFSPLLLLEMRASQIEKDHLNKANNKVTFDNFRALQNKLSQGIINRQEKLASGIIVTITCDKPTTMKNTAQDLYFTCQLMQDGKGIDEYGNLYEYYWTVTLYKEDGSILTTLSKLGKTTALMANEWLPSAVTFKVDLDDYRKVNN
ncbi:MULTISPECIES: phage tail spike protein [unclassified Enterococcus]|uniref:phage tail spike protein n=1 Tax=unclassified Enterococcus TaxID=2608891 RepID=UPI0032DE913D